MAKTCQGEQAVEQLSVQDKTGCNLQHANLTQTSVQAISTTSLFHHTGIKPMVILFLRIFSFVAFLEQITVSCGSNKQLKPS